MMPVFSMTSETTDILSRVCIRLVRYEQKQISARGISRLTEQPLPPRPAATKCFSAIFVAAVGLKYSCDSNKCIRAPSMIEKQDHF